MCACSSCWTRARTSRRSPRPWICIRVKYAESADGTSKEAWSTRARTTIDTHRHWSWMIGRKPQSWTELQKIPMTGIDEAWSKVIEKKARYRFVIDVKS